MINFNIEDIITDFQKENKIFENYKVKSKNKSSITYIFTSSDRVLLKEQFLAVIKKLKIPNSQDFTGSSIGRTKIDGKYNTNKLT